MVESLRLKETHKDQVLDLSVRAQVMTLSEYFAWLHLGSWWVQNCSMQRNRLMSLSGSRTKVQESSVVLGKSSRTPQ